MGKELAAVLGTQIAGTATTAYGQHMAGEAANRAARVNAAITRREVADRIARIEASARRNESTNITRVAKSGVRLSGSPLAVLEANEYRTERQKQDVTYAGDLAAEFQRLRGRDARSRAGFGLASTVLEGASRVGALAIRNA